MNLHSWNIFEKTERKEIYAKLNSKVFHYFPEPVSDNKSVRVRFVFKSD
jgi:hypothetical protein